MSDDNQGEGPRPLRDEITETLRAMRPTDGEDMGNATAIDGRLADSIMHLLNERGHYLPGCPPARQILKDAEQFAGQFTLAVLCCRLLRMLNTKIVTPETRGMELWLNDYLDGKNHGPIGKPMLWPHSLKGVCEQLRQWGYQPTATTPAFVARVAHPAVTLQ